MKEEISKFNENELIEEVIESLDISKSDYDRAVESYKAVGSYLESRLGSNVNIYPQGSFMYGTVTRPYYKGKDAEYDIDLVCKYEPLPDSAVACKTICGNALKSSKRYLGMLKRKEGRRCWTLEYSEIDDVDFHIDILPSKHAPRECIQELVEKGVPIKYAKFALKITTKKDDGSYRWDDSNPKGYKAWLDDVTSLYIRDERMICKDSVESVPNHTERKTQVHRVIQILKRHRDVRFDHAEMSDIKPISMIITTLVTKVAERNPNKSISVFDLLQMVISSFETVKTLCESYMRYDAFEESFIKRRNNGEWEIINPVDPNENFADKWHENGSERAKAFFIWTDWLKQDLISPLLSNDSITAFPSLSKGLGRDSVQRVYEKMKLPVTMPTLTIITKEDTKNMPKPWRAND